MSAKSFTHITKNGTKSEVVICSVPAGIRLTISGDVTVSGWFDSDQGAEIALAVLEASGVEPVHHTFRGLGDPGWLEGIAHGLKLHIEHEAKLTAVAEAEAKEQAKLEAEALKLRNACMGTSLTSWKGMSEGMRDQWVGVALCAREINKGEK